MIQILLVEDDTAISKALQIGLKYRGFEVTVAATIAAADKLFKSDVFDGVILDLRLPDGGGIPFCKRVRSASESLPILILTAEIDEKSAVEGLGAGADDYVRKPFGMEELIARLLRLLSKRDRAGGRQALGCIEIDAKRRLAWVSGAEIRLPKREFEVLALLVRRNGEVVRREEFLTAFGDDNDVYDRTIDSHLSRLRRKLAEGSSGRVQIVAVYGVGYRLEECK